MNIMKFILTISLSAFMSYLGKDHITNNSDAINLMVSLYSILSGFLVTIITIIGDPSEILSTKNWREAFYMIKKPSTQLIKACCLFYCYFITLILLFISMILPEDGTFIFKLLFEYAYIFFASLALIWSFGLPLMLVQYQKLKLESALQKKRNENNLQ